MPCHLGTPRSASSCQIGSDIRLYAPEIQRVAPATLHHNLCCNVAHGRGIETRDRRAGDSSGPARAQLERWRTVALRKVVLAPIPEEAESDSTVASSRIDWTQDAVKVARFLRRATIARTTRNNSPDFRGALAPEAVATVEWCGSVDVTAGDEDIPAFL